MKARKNDPRMVADLIHAWGLADELCRLVNGKLYDHGALLAYVIGGDSVFTLRTRLERAIDLVRKIVRQSGTQQKEKPWNL